MHQIRVHLSSENLPIICDIVICSSYYAIMLSIAWIDEQLTCDHDTYNAVTYHILHSSVSAIYEIHHCTGKCKSYPGYQEKHASCIGKSQTECEICANQLSVISESYREYSHFPGYSMTDYLLSDTTRHK